MCDAIGCQKVSYLTSFNDERKCSDCGRTIKSSELADIISYYISRTREKCTEKLYMDNFAEVEWDVKSCV